MTNCLRRVAKPRNRASRSTSALSLFHGRHGAFYGYTVPGWSSVIGVMLVVSAFQFMAMSIMAQYLGMVFEESKRRPLYVLKQARIGQRAAVASPGHGPSRVIPFDPGDQDNRRATEAG